MKLKDIQDHSLIKTRCGFVLQVSHHLGRNRVVLKYPNKRILDLCDFCIVDGDSEVDLLESEE